MVPIFHRVFSLLQNLFGSRISFAGEREREIIMFSIGLKIALPFFLILILMIATIGITMQAFNRTAEDLVIMQEEASIQGAAGNARFSITELLMFANDFIITGMDEYKDFYKKQRIKVGRHLNRLSEFHLSNEERAIINSIHQNLDSIDVYASQIFKIPQPRLSPEAVKLMEVIDYTFGRAIARKTTEIFDIVFHSINDNRMQFAETRTRILNRLYVIFFLALFFFVSIVYITVQRIAKPIKKAAKVADAIARGDYAQRLESLTRDEVGLLARSLSNMAHEIQRAHNALEISRRFTENIVATVPSGLVAFGENLEVLSVNRSFCELFGVSTQEVVGKPVDEILESIRFPEESRTAIVRRQRFRNCECTISTAAKGTMALNLTLSGIRVAAAAEEEELLLVVDDITERKRAEMLQADLSLSRVLESIAADQELPQVLEDITFTIEKYIPGMKASILLLDPATQCLRHGAAPSLPADYNAAIDGLRIGPKVGTCGTAAYKKELVIVENIQTDPLWEDYRELAAKHNLSTCWSQPIIDPEREAVLGTFALYYEQPRRPNEKELQLNRTASYIAGIAIKRDRAQKALLASEAKYRTLFLNVPIGVFHATPDGRILTANPALVKMLGYESEQELKKIDIVRDLYVKVLFCFVWVNYH